MGDGGVRKGYHYAWQIHYHIVFPVKYREALLDKEIDKIIEATAEGVGERYTMR
jgi:REP-associated tyrosine transposase